MDEPETLREIILALNDIAQEVSVIFPAHPRARQRIAEFGFGHLDFDFQLLEPLGYLDSLALMRHAALVITDSGGIQEETTYLGVPFGRPFGRVHPERSRGAQDIAQDKPFDRVHTEPVEVLRTSIG
ncbi:MAG: UDP-N-acetylglucosamine 2-epimerase, partial [Anaerolineae bacterium]